jgi:hypothetical protein
MLIEINTIDGPRKVRVCDYCRTVCIPSGRFCSSYCYHNFQKRRELECQASHQNAQSGTPRLIPTP